MAGVVLGVDGMLAAWAGQPGPILRLAILVPSGIVCYLLATTLLRSRELRELTTR